MEDLAADMERAPDQLLPNKIELDPISDEERVRSCAAGTNESQVVL